MHFGHLDVFLEKCLFRSSAHFLIGLSVSLIFTCMSYLYILEINSYWWYRLQNFLPFCRLSFHFIYSFLCCAKACKFNWVPFIFAFITLGDRSQKTSLQFMSKIVLPIFSILSLFFRMVLENVLISFFLHVTVQFSQHHLLKRLSFHNCVLLLPLS